MVIRRSDRQPHFFPDRRRGGVTSKQVQTRLKTLQSLFEFAHLATIMARKALTGPADPVCSTGYRNSRGLMTAYRVTQRHRERPARSR
jgi:hypothetical protein